MKRYSLLLFLLFIFYQGKAQTLSGLTGKPDTSFNVQSEYRKNLKNYPTIKIAERTFSDSVRVKNDRIYGKVGKRKLKLDLFLPVYGPSEKRTAVIFLFGGGWRSGNKTLHHPLAEKLARLGYVCFTPEYRLSTEALYPAAIFDIKAAIRWVRKHAKIYGIDPERIVVGGHSAGGEMAAFMGTTNDDPLFKGNSGTSKVSDKVNAVIDVDGTLSFIHPESGEGDDSKKISAATYWFGYSKTENPALWKKASPLEHVSGSSAPFLFLNSSVARMHAGRDDLMLALEKNGIYSKKISFEDAPHSFCFFHPWFEPMAAEMDHFLKFLFPPNN